MKQTTPVMKLTVVANMNVKLFNLTFTSRKVVRQQIWGKMLLVLIQASSIDHFEI